LPGGGSLYLFLAFFVELAFLVLETVFTIFLFFDAVRALVTGFALTGLDFALTVLGFALIGLDFALTV